MLHKRFSSAVIVGLLLFIPISLSAKEIKPPEVSSFKAASVQEKRALLDQLEKQVRNAAENMTSGAGTMRDGGSRMRIIRADKKNHKKFILKFNSSWDPFLKELVREPTDFKLFVPTARLFMGLGRPHPSVLEFCKRNLASDDKRIQQAVSNVYWVIKAVRPKDDELCSLALKAVEKNNGEYLNELFSAYGNNPIFKRALLKWLSEAGGTLLGEKAADLLPACSLSTVEARAVIVHWMKVITGESNEKIKQRLSRNLSARASAFAFRFSGVLDKETKTSLKALLKSNLNFVRQAAIRFLLLGSKNMETSTGLDIISCIKAKEVNQYIDVLLAFGFIRCEKLGKDQSKKLELDRFKNLDPRIRTGLVSWLKRATGAAHDLNAEIDQEYLRGLGLSVTQNFHEPSSWLKTWNENGFEGGEVVQEEVLNSVLVKPGQKDARKVLGIALKDADYNRPLFDILWKHRHQAVSGWKGFESLKEWVAKLENSNVRFRRDGFPGYPHNKVFAAGLRHYYLDDAAAISRMIQGLKREGQLAPMLDGWSRLISLVLAIDSKNNILEKFKTSLENNDSPEAPWFKWLLTHVRQRPVGKIPHHAFTCALTKPGAGYWLDVLAASKPSKELLGLRKPEIVLSNRRIESRVLMYLLGLLDRIERQ